MDTAGPVFAQIPGWGVAGIALQLTPCCWWRAWAPLGGGLLILLFTRWGQARPLAKCVALSVFAHILLLAFACGVRLFNDLPARDREGSSS